MKLTCRLGREIKVIEVLPTDPLHSLLQKLNISDKNTKFSFEGRTYPIFSIQTFSEIGINKDCSLFFNTQGISGGGGSEYNTFANLSDEFIKRLDVSDDDNIPDWRTVGKGINLHGICLNQNCVANGKQVINHIDAKEYNITDEGFMGICPMCGKHFDLDTCSFYKCDYKVIGTYFDKFDDKWVDLPDKIQKTNGGKVFYYDYTKNVRGKEGKVKYKRLILIVINYHDFE